MEFDPTERQVYWRDRVRDFIESNVRPRMGDYKKQDAEGERWKVLQVVEVESAALDLLDQLVTADDVGIGGSGLVRLGADGEDEDPGGLAGAVREVDGATDHLVGLAGVDP